MLDNMESKIHHNPEHEPKELPAVELKGLGLEENFQESFSIHSSDGTEIGYLKIHFIPLMQVAEIMDVKIDDQYRNQGYGQSTYIKLIELCKTRNMKLESSTELFSGAGRVWRKLIELGYAEEAKGELGGKYRAL